MRRTLSQGIAVATVALSVTVGITSCGVVNTLSAKQKVSKAMSSFADADAATFTLSLDTTPTDVAAIAQAAGEPLTASDTKLLDRFLATDVVYTVHAPDGKKLGDTMKDAKASSAYLKQAGAVGLSVRLSNKPLFEFRMVDGVAYAHAAGPKILQLAGENPAELDRALADLDLPPSLAKAAKGAWVSVDLTKAAESFTKQGGLAGLPSASGSMPTPSVDPSAVNKLLTDLRAAYEQKVTITELPKSERGDGFQLKASPKQVAAAIQDDVIKLAGDASATSVKQGLAKIPDTPITLNIWVKDDRLTGVALDLTQFMDKKPAGAKLALDVAVDVGSGTVVAPSGATPLDVAELIRQATSLGSSMGGGFSGSGSGLDDPYAGMPSLPSRI